jgi:hypothetical protein
VLSSSRGTVVPFACVNAWGSSKWGSILSTSPGEASNTQSFGSWSRHGLMHRIVTDTQLGQNRPVPRPRLFHFSEDATIESFVPRSVEVPTPRPPGDEWLNDPLVWAVTEDKQATYLFPRDCPRIVLWLTPTTTPYDTEK